MTEKRIVPVKTLVVNLKKLHPMMITVGSANIRSGPSIDYESLMVAYGMKYI